MPTPIRFIGSLSQLVLGSLKLLDLALIHNLDYSSIIVMLLPSPTGYS